MDGQALQSNLDMDQHINLLLQPDEEHLKMRVALACVPIPRIVDACVQRAQRHNESWLYLWHPQHMPFSCIESAW